MIRLIFIDDDKDKRRQWVEWVREEGCTASAFESPMEASRHNADYYIFDVSAVLPITNFSMLHTAYSPICRLMEDHPGATIIIVCAMGYSAVEEILDDIKRISGREAHFGGVGSIDDLQSVLSSLGVWPVKEG